MTLRVDLLYFSVQIEQFDMIDYDLKINRKNHFDYNKWELN